MPDAGAALPKMMLAFVVRRCTVDLGHLPSAAELAEWANNHARNGRNYRLFGRAITESEAKVILKHQARLVSAKSARQDERFAAQDDSPDALPTTNVVSLLEARVRRLRARNPGSNGPGNS